MPRQPTKRKKKHETDSGLEFPEGVTLEEISQLLDTHLFKDEPAPRWLMAQLNKLQPGATKDLDRRAAFERIWNYYRENQNQREMAVWFVYQVCRHLMGKTWDDPRDSGLDIRHVESIAEKLVKDPKLVASMKHYKGYDLDNFGEYEDGQINVGGSTGTIAYSAARDFIYQDLGINPKSGLPKPSDSSQHQERSDASSHYMARVVGIIIASLFFCFCAYLITMT